MTRAEGSNGVSSTGLNTFIFLEDIIIKTTGNSSRGIDATMNGRILAKDLEINTDGDYSSGIATAYGEGGIVVGKGKITTKGKCSPAVYSIGNIQIISSNLIAYGSEAAVIEGHNSIFLDNVTLKGYKNCGVMLFSGDVRKDSGSFFEMIGGSLYAKEGPLFLVMNTEAVVHMSNVKLFSESGFLIKTSPDQCEKTGSNGGKLEFNVERQIMEGDIVSDPGNDILIVLKDRSVLEGKISGASIELDKSSSWKVTADSSLRYIKCLETNVMNLLLLIQDNGYKITYDAADPENKYLLNKTYKLIEGGKLAPFVK